MKKNIILVSVFVVLLLIWFLQGKYDKHIQKKDEKAEFALKDTSAINKFEIKNKNYSYFLEKSNNGWFVVSEKKYKASDTKVFSLLNNLYNIKEESFITSDMNELDKYELSDSLKTDLKAFSNGDLILDLSIGSVTDAGKVYILNKKDNKIYLISQFNNVSSLKEKFNGWREKIILSCEESDISKISILNRKKELIELVKVKDDSFDIKINGKVEKNLNYDEIHFMISQLRSLAAIDFYDELNLKETELSAYMNIELKDNKKYRLNLYSTKRNNSIQYYLKEESTPSIYIVSTQMLDIIFPEKSKLMKKNNDGV